MGVNTFMNNQSFGKFIKTARETLGLTQGGLAAKSGLSQATISRIELDKQTNLTEDTKNVLLVSLESARESARDSKGSRERNKAGVFVGTEQGHQNGPSSEGLRPALGA